MGNTNLNSGGCIGGFLGTAFVVVATWYQVPLDYWGGLIIIAGALAGNHLLGIRAGNHVGSHRDEDGNSKHVDDNG